VEGETGTMSANRGQRDMTDLFATPLPDLEDQIVIAEIQRARASAADLLRLPRRWTGVLRRASEARAIQGSSTIEGYTVTDAEALAAVYDEPPKTADEATWAEIVGYRSVMTYVLNVATESGFVIDEAVLCAMHFMLLQRDLSKTPGRYRTGDIYVRDERAGLPAGGQGGVEATAVERCADLRTHVNCT